MRHGVLGGIRGCDEGYTLQHYGLPHLQADQQSSVLHLDNMEKLQNKLGNCIVASMSTGLSQFDTLC